MLVLLSEDYFVWVQKEFDVVSLTLTTTAKAKPHVTSKCFVFHKNVDAVSKGLTQ